MPEIIILNKFNSPKKENHARYNNGLYRCSAHFSLPNCQSCQCSGTFLLHPKFSLQNQVEKVVQGFIPKPAAEEARRYETAPSHCAMPIEGTLDASMNLNENLDPSKFSWEGILVFLYFYI